MIDLGVQVVAAKTNRVGAFPPGHVRGTHVLIVAEQKRVSGVVIAEIIPTSDIEERITILQSIWSIGARDLQHRQSVRLIDVDIFRTKSLTGITDVAVQNYI